METPSPNPEQLALIEGIGGTYLVDAGAGTGKTFALTERYARIIEETEAAPTDVLLVTFTRSAAREMKERVFSTSSYAMRELAEAPIQTFHSLCHDLLLEYGSTAPRHLGIDERITSSTEIIEDDILAAMYFDEWFRKFREDNPAYDDYFRIISSPDELHSLIETLAAKGVFPTETGWYRDGESILIGHWDEFTEVFEQENTPRNSGRQQSALRAALSDYGKDKRYLPEAPAKDVIRGARGSKQIDPAWATRTFDRDRSSLIDFIHDVYLDYLRFALRRNYVSFGFLQLFAYVLLVEEEAVREQVAFDYVMVDEFQDSSEIQFKLALLLAESDNLCVVGDWKQSIYSFQYADVDNIRAFSTRLASYTRELNRDLTRTHIDPEEITSIAFVENYRSTQDILSFSEHALTVPATTRESVDESIRDDIVSLEANSTLDTSRIEAYKHEDEALLVLSLIRDIVGNEAYAIPDDSGGVRAPEFRDIAVFSRTRSFCQTLLSAATTHHIPLAYDGGSEIFRTDSATLALAWLRILESDATRGWAVVLYEAGVPLDAIRHRIETDSYPRGMLDFREKLASRDTIGGTIQRIFNQYNISSPESAVLLQSIRHIHDQTTLGMGGIIQYIEEGIERGTTKDVSSVSGENAVTVQTIHAAKGLEYPIVILANMNEHVFPSRGGSSPPIQFREPLGLRQRKEYAHVHQYPHCYDNWRYDVLRHCIASGYDEERRLLYVAITRAESHLVFCSGQSPNSFLKALPVDIETREPTIEAQETESVTEKPLAISIASTDGARTYSPHTLMDESVFEQAGESIPFTTAYPDIEFGMEVGSEVHDFAEAYIAGEASKPIDTHTRHLAEFLDSLPGEKSAEIPITLPLAIGDDDIIIRGRADLVHETSERVDVIDYKTDRSRMAEAEYRMQLSVYYHVVAHQFPAKTVRAALYYTATDELISLDPLSMDELADIVAIRR